MAQDGSAEVSKGHDTRALGEGPNTAPQGTGGKFGDGMRRKTSQLAFVFAATGEFREAPSEGLEPSPTLGGPAALAQNDALAA